MDHPVSLQLADLGMILEYLPADQIIIPDRSISDKQPQDVEGHGPGQVKKYPTEQDENGNSTYDSE